MDKTTYNQINKSTEEYLTTTVATATITPTDIDIPGKGQYSINEDLLQNLCRLVGIPKSLNYSLLQIDQNLWKSVLDKLYGHYYEDKLVLRVVDDEITEVASYDKDLLSNIRFIQRVLSFLDDYDELDDIEILYEAKSKFASITVFHKAVENLESLDLQIGYVFENDAMHTATVRAALKDSVGNICYLTPQVFNLSSGRYIKTSDSMFDALNNMLITLSDLLKNPESYKSLKETIEVRLARISGAPLTYEEYQRVETATRKCCNVSMFQSTATDAFLADLKNTFGFHKYYSEVTPSDYIWRLTAYHEEYVSKLWSWLMKFSSDPSLIYLASRDARNVAGELLCARPLYQSLAVRK